ncbi:restriction endonuclease subunit S [Bacteroides thetaiotaomicron]|nr:restriction endonuclease subunit S [Bacteroides thetaiotaomicron]KAB4372379.1 restriction endonuclease subunit S [Bacteroides thetaiotaomicron]KAB4410290.1 restriction endonuclease subunit S [Bacteroides thetaiotaomicron]MCA5999573.1 restriction endonuclease subunit S [Bacteroides thetaiotaomicron]MCE8971023.1 restriction endonuclease subunit S [Bacteroides thetaiotaomicron]
MPFEVPDNWVWMTLGEVGTWQSGGTPSRSNKTYYGGNIPWLKTGDLNDGLISDIPESITEEAVANSSAKINPAGSVLIAMYGATIGKLGILTFPATTNQACCACIEFNAITQLYLFYFLLSQRNGFIAKGGGGAQPNISKEIIVNTFIPLPPLSEQQRIVMEIEKWFALIDQVEQGKADLQNTIKQTKSKILDLAIHGKLVPQDPNDEPAIKLLKRINPDFTPCDNGHYTQLPDGWTFCRLDQIIGYEQSTAYIVESTAYDDSYSTPVLTAGKSFIIGYTNEATGIYSNLPCIIFDDFTTDSKLVDFPFKVKSSAMKILKVHKDIEVDYVAMFMSITKLVGDTHKRYWISEYSKLEIPIPSKAEQKRIIHAIHGIFTQLDLIMESL